MGKDQHLFYIILPMISNDYTIFCRMNIHFPTIFTLGFQRFDRLKTACRVSPTQRAPGFPGFQLVMEVSQNG